MSDIFVYGLRFGISANWDSAKWESGRQSVDRTHGTYVNFPRNLRTVAYAYTLALNVAIWVQL